ncbi:sulfatase-like hydrolase/transferase [Longimicrobium terrae]|uniref:Arylsulfatase A-like enzyme n=1 Tax=Longimicrobium terrae TaxID=1639882 RepID=A0A841H3D4_9BACT|nr:sulfatase-like hydrolase/transferase [Longimicrobium terrae]MBB4638106.1 arylsulfatase A-like enzyme [Longimicrobium terrae]MBB6072478.1 arylsulfatase A-like enzyme [Longimicrobium terrae]NNC32111.1 sulfatase-like hydrolase/transferase [Longimicrobium terrae]
MQTSDAADGPGEHASNPASSGTDGGRSGMAGMNVVMFITDQDRRIQHFPPGWAEQNLPGLTRLQSRGVRFQNAFTNSCMCSPARATLMTGYFPAQHGVRYTLETSMDDPLLYDQVEMPVDFANLATVAAAAGYTPVYKGKWHLSKYPPRGQWEPRDVEKYGFGRWDPPDAGANQSIPEAGGGEPDNDGRFMLSRADADGSYEGALEYLESAAAGQQPFFLVVSLVNPHDVLFYPDTYIEAGYEDAWLKGDIGLPETVDEDLSTKPVVQREFLAMFNQTGSLDNHQMKLDYLNFYGNLIKASDQYLVDVLDTLDRTGLRGSTVVIRTADHGEMGLAHGGLRQKNFNAYEESLRVPLIFSSPALYDGPLESGALVSHVDFLPTIASLLHTPAEARAPWQGVDYSAVVLNPSHALPPQSYVVFTWDDWQAGQPNPPYLPPPNHIVCVRKAGWKLARYYDANGNVPEQWEMYDLNADPLEKTNLAWRGYQRTEREELAFLRLQRLMAEVEQTRLAPLPDTPVITSAETPRLDRLASGS